MRTLIHEMPYETPLRAGLFRYAHDGRATGAVERWRLTAAHDGYRFLRVDLDARDAASGHSYLYHLTLDPAGQAVQLKFRFWGGPWSAAGTVLREDDGWTAGRTVNEQRFETFVAGVDAFWFPACAGLGALAQVAGNQTRTDAVTLATTALGQAEPDPEALFALRRRALTLAWQPEETLVVARQERRVRPLLITWDDQSRRLWLDESNWPLKMTRQDGLVGEEVQDIRWIS